MGVRGAVGLEPQGPRETRAPRAAGRGGRAGGGGRGREAGPAPQARRIFISVRLRE